MTDHGTIRLGETDVIYRVTRSLRRKKTIQLTVDQEGVVAVAAPSATQQAEVEALIRHRATWILERRAEGRAQASPSRFAHGAMLPNLGASTRLAVTSDDSLRHATIDLRDGVFDVRVTPHSSEDEQAEVIREAFAGWYRQQAAAHLDEAVGRWGEAMGVRPTNVLVRNQKRRWGSCSADGTLRFNLRVAMLAPGIIDYIVVHELAHLVVRNHSAAFWRLVEQAMPDAQQRRKMLREASKQLPQV